ncbi:MAG: hypothetical protein DRO67_09525 [Candidatus Asgardarchaeum californiense]|nr:MAG: hypothetical protein DRO67_09525 [Candidatus Asgardarchaeum californiense]
MEDKLRKDVEAVVAKIFSEKEEADIRRQTEEALSKSAATIEELTDTLEARNIEFEELETKLSETEFKVTDYESELEAAREEIEDLTQKLEESKNTLEEMKKDRAAELRMKELTEAGVVSDTEAQLLKVREMSDEDFTSYKDELVSIREAVIAELSKNEKEEAETEDASTKDTKEEAEETEDSEENEETAEEEQEEMSDDTSGEEIAPANIDPGKAISAALNMEIFPPEDMVNKYREMGKAMADSFVKDND